MDALKYQIVYLFLVLPSLQSPIPSPIPQDVHLHARQANTKVAMPVPCVPSAALVHITKDVVIQIMARALNAQVAATDTTGQAVLVQAQAYAHL